MARWNSRTLPHWDQIVCPECANNLDLQEDDISDGEIVSCADCGAAFEVMTRPFELRRIEDHGSGTRTGTHRPAA
jgi:transcription initiation factor TFIIIB Brf1 subunit/transcription initiation factor TFIIB